MNLISRKLSAWFRGFFHGGLQAVAAEEAAAIQADVLDAQARVFNKVVEIRRQARQSIEAGDEVDRELAAALDASLRQTLELGKAMLSPVTGEERAEVLSRPLPDSGGAPTSLPPASAVALMAPETSAPESNGTPPALPVRRGRGRPRGSRTRSPRPESGRRTEPATAAAACPRGRAARPRE
ncbi:MAG: hypothetical protein U0790_03565 [Isosphaeraceae bacterium]